MDHKDYRNILEKMIFDHLDNIRNCVMTKSSGDVKTDIQTLMLIEDELGDILLNWDQSGDLEDED